MVECNVTQTELIITAKVQRELRFRGPQDRREDQALDTSNLRILRRAREPECKREQKRKIC